MKSKKIKEIKSKLRSTADPLGKGIDEGIINTVIALNYQGIPTFASCEGHINRGEPYPWVDLGNPEAKEVKEKIEASNKLWQEAQDADEKKDIARSELFLKKYHEMRNEIEVIALNQYAQLFDLLKKYYSRYIPACGMRIIAVPIGPFIRIQPEDGILQKMRNHDKRKIFLKIYRNEFDKLAIFLTGSV